MRYIETVLETDERVLARGRLHWIVYGPAVCGFTLGCLLLLLARAHEVIPVVFLGAIGSLAILVTPILLIQEWIKRRTTEIAVTSQRVIIKRGLFRRNTIEMNAGQIESVQLNQSILGRLLDK